MSVDAQSEHTVDAIRPFRFHWGRSLALSGVAFFVLLVINGFIANDSLDDRSSGSAILDQFRAHEGANQLKGGMIAVIVVVGVVFYAVLRDFLRRDPANEHVASVAFGGALLFAAGGAMGSGITYTLAHAAASLDASSAKALYDARWGAGLLQDAGIAVLAFSAAYAILRTSVLPRWTGWLALVPAIAALVPPVDFVAFIGIGIWTLCVSIVMFRRLPVVS